MLSLDRHGTTIADSGATGVSLTLALARLHNTKDFGFAHSLYFRNRYIPFALEWFEVNERFCFAFQILITAFSLRFCLIVLERTFARLCFSRSNKYAGRAPSGTSWRCFVSFSSWLLIVFFIWIFSFWRRLLYNLALGNEVKDERQSQVRRRTTYLMPRNVWAFFDKMCGKRPSFFFLKDNSCWLEGSSTMNTYCFS